MHILSLSTKSFNKILSKIIKSESGIKKVLLVDRTGLTIAHVSKFSYYPVDVDGIGAIASAVFCASEEQGRNLELGELSIVTSEFNSGKIFAASCGKGVLCLMALPIAAKGHSNIRLPWQTSRRNEEMA